MKKVIVIGCPGSGKSTFSRKLGKKLGLPVVHLDNLFWNADKTNVSKEVFDERLEKEVVKDSWIIDGNFARTLEKRMKYCDTIIFLDYPVEVCLSGYEQRRGKIREDIPWVETERDEEFVEFIENFKDNNVPKMLELLKKYQDRDIIVFKTREEAKEYLEKL